MGGWLRALPSPPVGRPGIPGPRRLQPRYQEVPLLPWPQGLKDGDYRWSQGWTGPHRGGVH